MKTRCAQKYCLREVVKTVYHNSTWTNKDKFKVYTEYLHIQNIVIQSMFNTKIIIIRT